MNTTSGIVYLVGAGPGDPALITVQGLRVARRSDVILYDHLVDSALLSQCRSAGLCIDVGKRPGGPATSQQQINDLLVSHARAGRSVCRLKGGDPFLFGRGGEELAACRQAGIPCVVIPGVSSAWSVPLAAGIDVSRRGLVRSVGVVTAHARDSADPPPLDYASLATLDTLIVLMGDATLATYTRALLDAGKPATTPAASIERGTWTNQRVVATTLARLPSAVAEAGLTHPLLTVIGPTAADALDHPWRSAAPLWQRRVVLTGSPRLRRQLARRLNRAGAVPVHLPCIRIEALPTEQANVGLDQPGAWDWIIFPSTHAVTGFARHLAAVGRDVRVLAGCSIAAIGRRTAAHLRRRGLMPDVVARRQSSAGLRAALLATGESINDRKVLYPCSNIAGTTLTDWLAGQGADVRRMAVYATVLAPPAADTVATALTPPVDAVVLASPSAVEGWSAVRPAHFAGITACLGPVTAAAARQRGVPVDCVADEHSAAGMVDALERYFHLP